MKNSLSDDLIYRELGVRFPNSYLSFINDHFKDLDEDPSNHCCWKSGFGNISFVIGTTQAFRSVFKDFPKDIIIIGYGGTKRVSINHQEMETDIFIALNASTSEVFWIDTLGNIEKVSSSFDEWIKGFITWLEDKPIVKRSFSVQNLLKKLKLVESRNGERY